MENKLKPPKLAFPSNKIGIIKIAHINALNLSQTQKELVKLSADGHIKINVKNIIWICQIDKLQIPGLKKQYLWVENDVSTKMGYKHMLTLANEFQKFGITNNRLPEIAEAATSIGILGFLKGKKETKIGRPVFVLKFYGKCLAVAISVGDNGFVIDMNNE